MGKITLITGAPGAGKSTISRLIAETFSKSVHLEVDKLRGMMVGGIELPVPGNVWSDAATAQFEWSRDKASYMAQLYAEQDFAVIIDDVGVPEKFSEQYQKLFEAQTVQRILLLPTADALIKRLKKRADPFYKNVIIHVPWMYSCLELLPKAGWQVVDSSELSVEETFQQVMEIINK